MEQFQLSWKIESLYDGMLIKDYLINIQNLSRRALTAIKYKDGGIYVNGEEKTVRFQLSTGDNLIIKFPSEERSESVKSEEIALDIVYEDPYVIVINKPPNMAVIPSREHPSGTVANAVFYHYEQIGLASTIHIINRLDRDTSGLMLVAKHRYVHYLFSLMQTRKEIHRTYYAIVHGKMSTRTGTINRPIGRKDNSIIERHVCKDGQAAITHFEVVKRDESKSLLEIKLETGRTHQIRVHLSYIGHPLLGDDLYGGKTDMISRQALHSFRLSFYHPFYEKECHFEVGLPEDLQEIL